MSWTALLKAVLVVFGKALVCGSVPAFAGATGRADGFGFAGVLAPVLRGPLAGRLARDSAMPGDWRSPGLAVSLTQWWPRRLRGRLAPGRAAR